MGVGKVHGEMEGMAIKWALEVSVYSWQPWEWRPPKPDHRIDAWRKKQGPQTVVSKTKHSKTKTEAQSTQISKTKHPKLENEAPKSWKWSTQNSKTKHPELENEAPKTQKRSTQISKPL